MDKLLVWKKTITESVVEDSSRTLASKKECLYQVIKVCGPTGTIVVRRLHSTVSIDKVILGSEIQRTSKPTTHIRSPAEIGDQPSNGDKRILKEKKSTKLCPIG